MVDPRLAWALVTVVVRYLTTIQPHAKRELARWRQHALAIPDPELRAHVLRPFDADGSAIGASLFAVLAPLRMQRRLVRLLIAYVLLWSYVDVRTERDPDADPRLYDALVDALRPEATTWLREDGSYRLALLNACRRGCAALPGWDTVQPAALRISAAGSAVQSINHGPSTSAERRLRAWAQGQAGCCWQERCAAASSPLALHALMALAANGHTTVAQAVTTATAYESVSTLGVLCDHFIDRSEDKMLTNHSYLRYLGVAVGQAQEMASLADRAARGVRALAGGERHVVLLSAMVAMFLSNRSAWSPSNADTANAMLQALGQPTPFLMWILRTGRSHGGREQGPVVM